MVPAHDSSLTLQSAGLDQILTASPNKKIDYEETDMPEEIIEKIREIMKKGPIKIMCKQDVRTYLLLTFYMQKLNEC